MAMVKLTQVIHRPVEEVFRTVVDVANFPKWNPTIVSARKLSQEDIGEGSRFELEIKGFGKTLQELQEFRKNKTVRLVPQNAAVEGGHRFIFTGDGRQTQIDHELEMRAKGFFKIFSPLMGIMGKKNLRQTAEALRKYMESPVSQG